MLAGFPSNRRGRGPFFICSGSSLASRVTQEILQSDEWFELLGDKLEGARDEVIFRQYRADDDWISFWTNANDVAEAVDSAVNAVKETNEEFEDEYAEILEAQSDVMEQLEEMRQKHL